MASMNRSADALSVSIRTMQAVDSYGSRLSPDEIIRIKAYVEKKARITGVFHKNRTGI